MKLKLIAIFAMIPLMLQAMDIAGKIVDGKGKPVKKVQVMIHKLVSQTYSNGIFNFRDVKESDTLVVYPSKTYQVKIPLSGSSFYDIRLDKKTVFLKSGDSIREFTFQRVVANKAKSGLITRDQIAKSGANDLVELLRGRVPGLQIMQGDNGFMAIIRGGTSMSLNSEPLFLIDGAEFEGLSAASRAVNINDIETIEVLKEGFSYGLKGANGVIIIKCSR